MTKTPIETSGNTVEHALIAAKADPSRQGALQLALLSAELYVVPTDGLPAEGQVFGVDVPFQVRGVVLKEGQKATALFTSADRAGVVFGDAAVMAMRGHHALEIMGQGWLVLDPGSENGLVLSPTDSQAILAGFGDARLTTEADFATAVTMPEREPVELVERLRRVLSNPIVSAAWLGRIQNAETGVGGWRLDVRTEAVFADLKKAVEQAAVGLDFHGETLDIFASLPGGPDGVGIKII